MNKFIYNLVGLLLIVNVASAQGNTYLRGDLTKIASEQPRNLVEEPIIAATIIPTSTPAPVGDCYSPYYNDGTSCKLCDNGIISPVNPDSDIEECTPCGSNEYIQNNVCVSSCKCAAEGDWAETYCGYYAFRACPEDTMGTSRRLCNNGVWSEVDDSGCLPTSDIEYASGAGMITIPITLKDYPPFVDNKDIPLYLIKAILNQYPYQLNDIQVIMENTYDNVNKNQIARILIRSSSIFSQAIISSISDSVNELADKLGSINNIIFNTEVTSNIDVDSETIEQYVQYGMCFIDGLGVALRVGYTDDTLQYQGCPSSVDNYIFQCSQDLLNVFPYEISYRECVESGGMDTYFIQADGNNPIDLIKSNFYKNIYGLMLRTIKYPKTQLFIGSVYSRLMKVDDHDAATILIKIYTEVVYEGNHTPLKQEVVSIMRTAEFKAELEKITNVQFSNYMVGYSEA